MPARFRWRGADTTALRAVKAGSAPSPAAQPAAQPAALEGATGAAMRGRAERARDIAAAVEALLEESSA